MKEFVKWFIKDGEIKRYAIAIIIWGVMTGALLFSDEGIASMIEFNDVPVLAWIGMAIAYFGFTIGIIWHIIHTFRKRNL